MNTELLEAIQLLEKEKNISKESLIEGIEGSLLSACKEHFKSVDNIKLEMDHDTCEYSLYAEKTIVDGERQIYHHLRKAYRHPHFLLSDVLY